MGKDAYKQFLEIQEEFNAFIKEFQEEKRTTNLDQFLKMEPKKLLFMELKRIVKSHGVPWPLFGQWVYAYKENKKRAIMEICSLYQLKEEMMPSEKLSGEGTIKSLKEKQAQAQTLLQKFPERDREEIMNQAFGFAIKRLGLETLTDCVVQNDYEGLEARIRVLNKYVLGRESEGEN